MTLEIKKLKVDVGYHKIEDGIVEEVDIDGDIYKLVKPEMEPENETKPETPKTEVKHRKRSRKGVIGFSKSYRINIIKKDVGKVLMAIQHVELKYKPTTEMIGNETGLTKHRVLAVLAWLRDKAVIKRTTDNEGTMMYRIVNEDWKP